jgi:hypothetical protein
MDECFPLWIMAPVAQQGLGFTDTGVWVRSLMRCSFPFCDITVDIGIVNACGGVSAIIMQTFVYHRVANKLKLINTFRYRSPCIWIVVLLLSSVLTFIVGFKACECHSHTAIYGVSTVTLLDIIQEFRRVVSVGAHIHSQTRLCTGENVDAIMYVVLISLC